MNLFKNLSKETLGIIICIFSAIIFGVYPPAARAVYEDGGNIVFVVLITTFARAISLYSFALFQDKKPFSSPKESKLSFIGGFFQAISIIGILGGTFYLPGAVVIIIMFTYSLMLLFFTSWKKEMKLNSINISCTIFALVGLAFVLNVFQSENNYPLVGVLLAFMAAIATFSRTYIYSFQSRTRSPITIGAENFAVTSALVLLLLFYDMPIAPKTSEGILMIVLVALSLSIGSFGMFYGIAYLNAYKFSIIMKLEPIFTALFGILLLNEVLAVSQYLGITIVIASLVLIQVFDRQKN